MKKLIIIVPIILLIVALIVLVPVVYNLKRQAKVDPEIIELKQEQAIESYDEVIAQYQKLFDYPTNMIDILDLRINYGLGCMLNDRSEEVCNFYYAYHDLNNDGVDELIFAEENDYSLYIVDIYYYDGIQINRLFGDMESSGFWYRNKLTIFESGKFFVSSYGGASEGSERYYGDIKESSNILESWKNFGLVYEYVYDFNSQRRVKYNSKGESTNISESEYNKLSESYGKEVDYKNWEWKKFTKDPDFVIPDRYKPTDCIYLVEEEDIVKGIVTSEFLKTDFSTYEINPKLKKFVSEIAYDKAICEVQNPLCDIWLATYNYPYKYMKEVKAFPANTFELHFVVLSLHEVLYDTDDDGYVDEKAGFSYLISPINEYDRIMDR